MQEHRDIYVFVVERDIYARQAIVSYLSWDRRTRVAGSAGTIHEMLAELSENPVRLDAVVLDIGLATDATGLVALIEMIHRHLMDTGVICMAHYADCKMALAAGQTGAQAFLVRDRVGIGIASAVRFSLQRRFVTTCDVLSLLAEDMPRSGFFHVDVLPERRRYSRLTQRIEQALWLCVVEGLPAELAAEEMGVSTNTVRSYIKEGYRILESEDDTLYPTDMSPVERAFLRYSALKRPEAQSDMQTSWEPAA
jgi:DNA-binding NarL/FixJ family response regulator